MERLLEYSDRPGDLVERRDRAFGYGVAVDGVTRAVVRLDHGAVAAQVEADTARSGAHGIRVRRLPRHLEAPDRSVGRELGSVRPDLSHRRSQQQPPLPALRGPRERIDSGRVSSENLDEDLRVLDLNANELTGTIPAELGNMANLRLLELTDNQLTGTIPPELGNIASLTDLNLDLNRLTGTIPPELGNLTNLDGLELDGNQLTGTIPPELGSLPILACLRLEDNQLTGSIPPELGNLTLLLDLRLDGNQLTGSIPVELGNLTRLNRLDLDHNQLTGSIPVELGSLPFLAILNMNVNQLTGSIPVELGNLFTLTTLRLSTNPSLSGTLPLSLINLARLDRFWFDNTTLCVPPDATFQAWLQGVNEVRSTGLTCTPTATEEPGALPTDFVLEANYPNPFNPATRIRYAVPHASSVRLAVYDVQGRLVEVLVEAEQPPGWHEVTFEARGLPSGVYFYRLEAEAFRVVRQMLLLQ